MESDQQRRNAQRLIIFGWRALITACLMTVALVLVAPHLSLLWVQFLAVPVVLIFVLLLVGVVFTFLGNMSLRRL